MSKQCPVCGSRKVNTFLQRKKTPVHQNLLYDTFSDAVNCDRGDLEMCICRGCNFVFNSSFSFKNIKYGPDYDNRQDCSKVFREHLECMANELLINEKIQKQHIVEVGCGQGDFLRLLVTDKNQNAGTGFDPSYVGNECSMDGRLSFINSYYGAEYSNIKADVVVCRHVIEHVPDPLVLLGAIRSALKDASNTRIFFETPCVEWILKNFVVWDFFYEHCSLFSEYSIRKAFACSGFKVLGVKKVFYNQYLWVEAEPAYKESQAEAVGFESIASLSEAYAIEDAARVKSWKERLVRLNRDGKVALWGAGAKGITFANLIDPGCEIIDSVVDINKNKQGRFVAGSGHPIIAYKELKKRNITNIILMNPAYKKENEALLKHENLKINLLT